MIVYVCFFKLKKFLPLLMKKLLFLIEVEYRAQNHFFSSSTGSNPIEAEIHAVALRRAQMLKLDQGTPYTYFSLSRGRYFFLFPSLCLSHSVYCASKVEIL